MTAWQVYRQPRLILILLMGFASGLPLALTGATLTLWLSESGISLKAIGLYALVGLSYNFKVLWAPFLDFVVIPGLTRKLGRRRSWLILLELCLAVAVVALGNTDPSRDLPATVVLSVLVAFLSASQDIVIDAFRVELLSPEEQGAGAAATQMGFRLGMIASGAGALYIQTAFGWRVAYEVMACLFFVGIGAALVAPKLDLPELIDSATSDAMAAWRDKLHDSVVLPLQDFFTRPGWPSLLFFIVCFNLGNALAGHMANTFFNKIGFSNNQIADISKLLGVVATMAGVALGGVLVFRLGVARSLVICLLIQMAVNLLYVVQAAVGHNLAALALTVSGENLGVGMGAAAFVAFLSDLCDRRFTATQYALLSGFALLGRNLFASAGGELASWLGWEGFFTLAAGLGLPSLIVLLFLIRSGKFPAPTAADAGMTS